MDVDTACYDNRIEGGLYDVVIRQLMALPKGVSLGDATYKDDFIQDTSIHTGNFTYKCKENGAEYETVLVGEILPRPCDTKLSAMGNHYVGTAGTPNVIDDKARVKGVLALGKPTQATEMMYITFGNQIATLDDIIQSDIEELKKQNKDMNIKEWTAHGGSDQTGVPEYIIVNTEQLYAVPKAMQQAMQGKCARVAKKAISSRGENPDNKVGDISPTDTGAKENTHEGAVTTNMFYEPTMLPDYGGDLFQHINAKLRQLDIRDVNNELIAPQDWYSSLKRGTLVMVRATLHAFNWKELYQLNAHTIRVMDPSKLEMEPVSFQANGSDYGTSASTSKSRASDAMAGVKLGKRERED
ncbi:hypothetical protein DFJ58DRAFT_667921 [Suillus subalutaceus]|uniref:uncharacterized protein n=1 Tax=Suillus subalutaceus TaxID=48586 RepID=UPI001B869B0D|nr:uncharacterized protein DFJ58DRAFT_667921 [Suillus subalutaceus]KAG1839109.1 hypothetical protein DFJ58DRAFT_667921 [Suillus subalutaceus]